MRIAEVIGRLTLSKSHDSLRGATWLVAVPLTVDGLREYVARAETGPPRPGSLAQSGAQRGEAFVVYDELNAGAGGLIAVSEGTEAAAPFHPEQKPIDAYNAAILDSIEVD